MQTELDCVSFCVYSASNSTIQWHFSPDSFLDDNAKGGRLDFQYLGKVLASAGLRAGTILPWEQGSTNNGKMHHVSMVVMCLVYRYMYLHVCAHVILQRTSVCVPVHAWLYI